LAILLEHLGAHRHLEDRIFALGAMAVLAHAMMAGLRLEMLLVAVVDQRVEAIDAADDDIAPASAIAAIGAAELDEFLAQERHRAGTAIAGTDIDLGLIEEFHGSGLSVVARTGRILRPMRCPSRARQFGVDMAHLLSARKAKPRGKADLDEAHLLLD